MKISDNINIRGNLNIYIYGEDLGKIKTLTNDNIKKNILNDVNPKTLLYNDNKLFQSQKYNLKYKIFVYLVVMFGTLYSIFLALWSVYSVVNNINSAKIGQFNEITNNDFYYGASFFNGLFK